MARDRGHHGKDKDKDVVDDIPSMHGDGLTGRDGDMDAADDIPEPDLDADFSFPRGEELDVRLRDD